MKKIVELKNVSKTYNTGDTEFKALDNIDLSINKGEFVVILGPSGAGKSTLLNLIGGMDTPTSGSIKIDGEEISKYNGPVYLRLARVKTKKIYNENQKFEIGKAIQIGEGTDATVFATGVTVEQALIAKEKLEKQGVNIRVVDIHTIKPIDEEMIVKCAKETKKLISVEDHNIIGGLGSAISEILTNKFPAKLVRLGINDCFGMSGKAEELVEYFGIDSKTIIKSIV